MTGLESGIGTEIVSWFQGANPFAGWILWPFNLIGGQYGYLVLLPVIYWAVSKRDGKRLMILSLGSALVAQYLKFLFRRPRPFQVSPGRVEHVLEATGFGIPSGHTVFGTVVGGYAWYRFPIVWVRVVAVAFAVTMGVSRLVHGVHFPQDVLAGLLVGAAVLVLFRWIDTRYSQELEELSLGATLCGVGVLGVVTFLLTLLLEQGLEGRKEMLAIVGALIGGLAGFKLENRYVGFSHYGPVPRRIVRSVIGLALTVVVFVGLDLAYDAIAGENAGIGALILYVVRYGLVSLFVVFGAPALFVRLRLAGTDDGL